MSQPINLNKARKARARIKARATADQNALKFGRTKGQKQRDAAEADKAQRHLDGHEQDR